MMKLTIAVVIAIVHIKTSGNRDIHTDFVMAIWVDKGQGSDVCKFAYNLQQKIDLLSKHKNWKLISEKRLEC